MSSSLIATATLLGGAVGQAPSPIPPLVQHICSPSGGQFTPDAPVDGSTCLGIIVETGLGSMTDFGVAECNMDLPGGDGMRVKDGLMYLQYTCCEGGTPSTRGLCGDNFADGNVCTDPSKFQPTVGLGIHHCQGDEHVENSQDCIYEGESGWDENEDEKCDVGRMNLRDDQYALACASLEGSWVENKCFETNMWMMQMMKDRMSDMSWCSDPNTLSQFRMMSSCCHDGETHASHCPAPAPSPMGDGMCKNMEKYDAQAHTGSMYCEGTQYIDSKDKCMPFGRDDAWDETSEEKCDIGRIDDASMRESACAEVGGTWQGRPCSFMATWMFEMAGYCSFEGFAPWYNTAIAPFCCSGTEINQAHCGDDGNDDNPDDHHDGCTRISADAIRSARMKGYEPKFCH